MKLNKLLPSTPYSPLITKTSKSDRDYFTTITQATKGQTTNNTLYKLPKIAQSEIFSLAAHFPTTHDTEIKLLHREWEFSLWYCTLREGFTLCLYGYGSKRSLLDRFTQQYCTNYPLLTVNGYHPAITIRELKHQIAKACRLTLFTLDKFKDYMKNEKLYILIHNIDGPNLRTEQCQSMLAEIANIPNVYFICSIDHIHAALLWDQYLSDLFQFCYVDATNFADYHVETSFETTGQLTTSPLTSDSILHVLSGMTHKSRQAFRTLATWQCDTTNSSSDRGISFKSFYQICFRNFITSSDHQFRAQISEFIDHKVIVSQRDEDGVEYLRIPLSNLLLLQILADKQQSGNPSQP